MYNFRTYCFFCMAIAGCEYVDFCIHLPTYLVTYQLMVYGISPSGKLSTDLYSQLIFIQFIFSIPFSILILYFHLRPGHPSGLLPRQKTNFTYLLHIHLCEINTMMICYFHPSPLPPHTHIYI